MSETMPMPETDASPPRQVGDIFNHVPLTREHLKACFALFFVFAIEAWEMMIIVYTAPLIAQDFTLDALAVGHLIGAMFIGMLLGSLLWGKLAERIGRKGAVIWSLASYGVISLASAFAPDYTSLYALRLLSGVAAVGMMVVTFAHYQELLPVRYRGALTVYLASGWPIGMLLALGATVWLMPYGWRTIIAVSSLGGLCALVVARWVPESPYWLASAGRQLISISLLNRCYHCSQRRRNAATDAHTHIHARIEKLAVHVYGLLRDPITLAVLRLDPMRHHPQHGLLL